MFCIICNSFEPKVHICQHFNGVHYHHVMSKRVWGVQTVPLTPLIPTTQHILATKHITTNPKPIQYHSSTMHVHVCTIFNVENLPLRTVWLYAI